MSDCFARNDEGYLKDGNQWGEEWLSYCAKEEGLDMDVGLTVDHLKAIKIVRRYYIKHGVVPMVVSLQRTIGTSLRKLYELFSPTIYSLYKLAGVPGYITKCM